ncbi:hypothetical protein [Sorangium sp. So ce341]|uniref:hypothetical protein n=1 Tax=Sorangium sp. So ce341 TaxID=3133302 RepID=UPI003F604171
MMLGRARIIQFFFASCPQLQIDISEFDSGSAIMDVRLDDGRVLVIEHRMGRGYGVSFLTSEEWEGFSGHECVFSTEEQVIDHMKRLFDTGPPVKP